MDNLRQQISEFIGFSVPDIEIPFTTRAIVEERGYTRMRISYAGQEGDAIPAYLLLPQGQGPFPAVLVHHQHNSERHLGKSEVCGLVGDPLQAFAPVLAGRGVAVLAPDSICFEDRRRNKAGTEPDELDTTQHFNELCYRLVRGDNLMRKVLDDSARGINLLQAHSQINEKRIGILGHSYGGSTVLYHAALDTRLKFACSSGAACTFRDRMNHGVGIEMSQVIPGFAAKFEMTDLVKCMAPRSMLLLSATEDKYAGDADLIFEQAQEAYAALGAANRLEHKGYPGGHPLTQERFDYILEWMTAHAFKER